MTITLTVLATGILLFAALGAACNWAIFVRRLRSSMVCLVSLPLSLIGCALHPFLPWYAGFLAVPLDPGVFLFVRGVPYLLRRICRGKGAS